MKRIALLLLLAFPLFAATPDNDASCDIGQFPAATLLLPYFEVDLDDRNGETTIFTVVNVTNVEAIAHVTLWTDHAVPIADFDIFLTGYDTQSINLYDVISLGQIAPPLGTGYDRAGSPEGDFSHDNANPRVDEQSCANIPKTFTSEMRTIMRRAFTEGVVGTCDKAGGVHENAVGYATIDVVKRCGAPDAHESGFVEALLHDNVLTGDYAQIHSSDDSAQGAPLVHIRAIPEGGGEVPFERTFYSNVLSGQDRNRDGRQPLPSVFAARWIDGGPGEFKTKIKVWRESISGARACGAITLNARRPVVDVVRFDEDGNLETFAGDMPSLPVTSLIDIRDSQLIPPMPNEPAGWTYLNFGAQAWVVSSMRAEGRFSTDVEATAFGNGCSPEVARGGTIAPAPNQTATLDNDDSCDIALLPAATLLLPYFEVNVADVSGENTLFTVTNTTAVPRTAHVTLWTDYAFPVLNFDVILAGYDSQSISLRDVIVLGRIPALCGPSQLPEANRQRVMQAFTAGRVPEVGSRPACNDIGSAGHRNGHAVGYATIDLVDMCTALNPDQPAYYDRIGYDNVLTGDYQQVHRGQEYAQGAPLVHIRAIPEGNVAGAFERTFYGRFTDRDARQPLPSTFTARYIDGGTGSFETWLKIWREGQTGANTACTNSRYEQNNSMVRELVTFDEEENAQGLAPVQCPITCPVFEPTLPATGAHEFGSPAFLFPTIDDAIAGWIYLNLGSGTLSGDALAQQAWVTSSMRAEGRYSIDVDGTALGNGCSPDVPESEINFGTGIIGPAPNDNTP